MEREIRLENETKTQVKSRNGLFRCRHSISFSMRIKEQEWNHYQKGKGAKSMGQTKMKSGAK